MKRVPDQGPRSKTESPRAFSGGPVVMTPSFQAVQVQSLVRELGPHVPCSAAKERRSSNLEIKSPGFLLSLPLFGAFQQNI